MSLSTNLVDYPELSLHRPGDQPAADHLHVRGLTLPPAAITHVQHNTGGVPRGSRFAVYTQYVWSGLLPGPGNTYICVYVGAAPLQRHPTVCSRTGVRKRAKSRRLV